jgi:hypothetical protein
MMQIEDNALLCITAVQPSRTPANTIQPKPSDTISTLVLFVLEQLLERLSIIIIRETQPTLEGKSPHNLLEKGCLSAQIRLRAAQRHMYIIFQCNCHLMECALEVMSFNIRGDMRQVV